MSKFGPKYERVALDHYPTPGETTAVALRHVKLGQVVCDPCCGPGRKILKEARRWGYTAVGSDIIYGTDFFSEQFERMAKRVGKMDFLTNPPYGGRTGRLAVEFTLRCLRLSRRYSVILLPLDFDSGATRQVLFGRPDFAMKIILTNRIRWFNGSAGMVNHAWYVFDKKHEGPPTITYVSQEYRE